MNRVDDSTGMIDSASEVVDRSCTSRSKDSFLKRIRVGCRLLTSDPPRSQVVPGPPTSGRVTASVRSDALDSCPEVGNVPEVGERTAGADMELVDGSCATGFDIQRAAIG